MADLGRQLADLLYGESQQPKETTGQKIARRLTGAGETAATIGTGLLGSVPAGLAGLTQLIPTRGRAPDVNRAAQKVEDVQSALTYLPRTETGQRYLQNTAGALETLGAPAEYLGEKALQYTGSPAAATATNVLLDPVNFIGLPGSGKATVAATKAAGRAAMAAPRVAGDILSEALTPASRFESQRGAINLGGQFEPQSTLGLVSRADQAAAALPRQKGTGAEFLRELQKTPGVSPAEIEDRGLTAALSPMGKVTKNDFLKALEDNPPVKFEEVVLGQGRIKSFEEWVADQGYGPGAIQDFGPSLRRSYDAFAQSEGQRAGGTKYNQYTTPGGENYREILLTLPSKEKRPMRPEESPERNARMERTINLQDELRALRSPRRIDEGETMEQFTNRYYGTEARSLEFEIEKLKAENSREFNEMSRAQRDWEERVAPSQFNTPHWKEPNVLAHARISDRTGPNGEKILHVEEVQSDWHQQGRKGGYKTGKEEEQLKEFAKEYDRLTARRRELLKQAEEDPKDTARVIRLIDEANDITPQLMRLGEQADQVRMASREGVPDAPFKKNWHELMMRRLVNYAAENGYDRIAITPGAEQVSRYDLSKHVDKVAIYGDNKLVAFKNGTSVTNREFKNESELAEIIGKEAAKKLLESKPDMNNIRSLEGQDLQVGGEGMKGFYDKIIPTYLNNLGKPYGSKVTQDNLYKPDFDIVRNNAARHYGEGSEAYNEAIRNMTIPVHSFAITPQMREAIKSKGLPLYKKGGSVRISDNPDTMRLELATGGAVGQERSTGSKLVGGGVRGAGMRAIFGMDLPEDATKAEREVYANVTAMSNTPGPWALAAAPAALVKGAKGAKAVKAAKEEAERSLPLILPRAPAKSKEEIAAHAERVGRQMLGEHVTSGKPGDTKNLAGRSRKENERIKRIEYELEAAKAVPESQVVQSQIGDINVAFPGDYSLSDVYLKTLEGEPIGSLQQGGSRFGLGKLDMKNPLFWASNEGPAQMVQNKITEVADVFNPNRVIGQHLAMGRVANNFAQHFADASLRAIDYSKVSRNDMELFDTVIAAGYEMKNPKTGERVQISFPEWPGIADPEGALAEMKKNPELRKWFLSRMKTPKLTKATNMPNGLDIEWAITSPDLRNMEVNLTGHSVGELVPGAKLTDDAAHETYSKGIRGRYLGHQEALTPFVLSFPDATQHIMRTQRPQDFTGTIQKVFPHQIVDQQYLDELGEYKRRLDRVILGKKNGGAVKMQAGGAIKAAAKAASKAVKPSELTPEARAAAAEVRANTERIGKARAELEKEQAGKEYFQRPEGYGSTEKVQERAKKIKERETYPQAEALERARLNAVKMLGLPEDNTAMDRARALGFMDDTFHGTFGRFEDFDLSKANPRSQYMPGLFTADDPRLAENFGDFIMPLMQRKGVTVLEKRAAREAGLPVPEANTIHDKSKGIRVTNDLSNVRSRFAAFDPAESDKPGLLKKKGGKVKFTDNLDAMRLAVQKRK